MRNCCLFIFFQITDLPAVPVFINSAANALDVLEAYKEEEFPDFIIVDINMPFISGYEFAEIFTKKFGNKYPNSYLFVYSTSIHSKDILKAKTINGVEDFISKPFDENTFNSKIPPRIVFPDRRISKPSKQAISVLNSVTLNP